MPREYKVIEFRMGIGSTQYWYAWGILTMRKFERKTSPRF